MSALTEGCAFVKAPATSDFCGVGTTVDGSGWMAGCSTCLNLKRSPTFHEKKIT
jgi:hypothetical protein